MTTSPLDNQVIEESNSTYHVIQQYKYIHKQLLHDSHCLWYKGQCMAIQVGCNPFSVHQET